MAKWAAKRGMDPVKLRDTLVKTVFPNERATPEQVAAFALAVDHYDLDPFLRQIYAFPDKGGGIQPIISVDGWYAIANRDPNFDGMEFQIHEEDGKVVACTATVHRKDRNFPTVVTEYVEECKRNTPPWNQQTRRMIRHRAAIQAIRIAFGVPGLDPEEAERIPEYEVQAGGEEEQVHAPTLEGAMGRLDDAEMEERARAEAPESGRRRRSRAIKDQREEFTLLIKAGDVDPGLISPHLPSEGETVEDAFATLWRDDAEGILERVRAGEFKAPEPPSDPAVPAEPSGPPPDDPFSV